MKMIRNIAIVLVIIICFRFESNAQKITTVLELNDYIADITDSLHTKGVKWGSAFKTGAEQKNFAALAPIRKDLISFIDKKLLEVVTLKDINGSEKLRLATIDFLLFEKRMIVIGFEPVENLRPGFTEEEKQKALEQLTDATVEEEAYLGQLQDAQMQYAQKNNFKIAQ